MFGNWWKGRDRKDWVLLLWYALLYGPFFIVLWKRQGFLYHMLPATIPMVLIVVRALEILKRPKLTLVLLAAALIMTIFFFPVLTNMAMPNGWYENLAELIGT